jgi:hypothetical protein
VADRREVVATPVAGIWKRQGVENPWDTAETSSRN